jgi:hypothetical protein
VENKMQMHWPTGYMTQNARHIYNKLKENVTYPDVSDMIGYYENPVDVDAVIDDIFLDISNYLDREGVILGG